MRVSVCASSACTIEMGFIPGPCFQKHGTARTICWLCPARFLPVAGSATGKTSPPHRQQHVRRLLFCEEEGCAKAS